MAATETARRNHTTSTRRQADRRGRHSAAPAVEIRPEAAPSTTPAMHVTPDVVIAARGAVDQRRERRPRRSLQPFARDLRRFAA